jgi:hypothetical protein
MAKLLKNQKGFHHIALLLIIVIVAVVGFAGYRVFKASSPKTVSSVTPKTGCTQNLSGIFTKSFIDPDKILALRPLGFTTGTDHILPVDHTEFTLKVDTSDEKVPVYAPSQITITQISKHTDYTADGKPFTNSSNYIFDFTICSGVTGWSEFIQELSPGLQTAWDQAKKTHDEGQLNQGSRAVSDMSKINFTANAGDLIGYTSVQPSFALSIFDDRSKHPNVDFSYYSDNSKRVANAICFTDLYSGDLRKSLTDKYGYYEDRQGMTPGFTPRTAEPRCGQVFQNIVGTVQGDWFANRPKNHERLEAEGKTISFIHNNYDPSIGEISIGGNIVPKAQTFSFKPTHDTNFNREFSETKAGEIYCYKNDPTFGNLIFAPSNNNNQVLAELLDVNHLKIEVQPGDCNGKYVFAKPFIYER